MARVFHNKIAITNPFSSFMAQLSKLWSYCFWPRIITNYPEIQIKAKCNFSATGTVIGLMATLLVISIAINLYLLAPYFLLFYSSCPRTGVCIRAVATICYNGYPVINRFPIHFCSQTWEFFKHCTLGILLPTFKFWEN